MPAAARQNDPVQAQCSHTVVPPSGTPVLTPMPFAGTFQRPPTNQGTIQKGSATVTINGKAAARVGDTSSKCSEMPAPGTIQAGSPSVVIGG